MSNGNKLESCCRKRYAAITFYRRVGPAYTMPAYTMPPDNGRWAVCRVAGFDPAARQSVTRARHEEIPRCSRARKTGF
jgi:hypothetical protein